MAPSLRDFVSSYTSARSTCGTRPSPSHSGHMPPVRLNETFSARAVPTLIEPLADTDATLKENALGGPTCGSPSRLNRMRSMAWTSVTVPTVDRASPPTRSWSTTMAVVSPSSTSTSGRAIWGMKPCTNVL